MLGECLALLFMILSAPECVPGEGELGVAVASDSATALEVADGAYHADGSGEPDDGKAGDSGSPPPRRPSIGSDVVKIGGVTALVTLINPDVRTGVFTQGSLSHIAQNFRHPVRRAVEGGREDDDAFIHNRIAHPLSWGGMGYYLHRQGYSRPGALLFTQVHSVVWEYVIEGSFQKPSGKDLVTNFVSSAVGVWLLPGGLSPSVDPPGLSYELAF